MKSIILILLASVVVSLFSGLFFLVKDRDSPDSSFQPAPISSNRALRSAPLAGR
jgi:hypothetical protein